MYNAFFGVILNPFNMSPALLTGEVSTGKTTMLKCLRDFLNAQQIVFASLFNSRLTVPQFFEMLAYDFDLGCNRLSKTEVLPSLNHRLHE